MIDRSKVLPLALLLLCLVLVGPAVTIRAGGFSETLDITGRVPTPNTALWEAPVIPVRWDERCIPAPFRLNATQDPIPNPLGDDFLTLEEARQAVVESFEVWNSVPTSFAELRLEGTSNNPGLAGFDMVNEVTFRITPGFDRPGRTTHTALMEDTVFTPGLDLDGDGDSDVAAGLTRCADADGDGDFEFPPGFYPAGTLLDVDIQFNVDDALGVRLTVGVGAVDDEPRSFDLTGLAVHEAGHAVGLTHSLTNQISRRDGTSASMFPDFFGGDRLSELAIRQLHVEDVAAVSAHYPEGTAPEGPAQLQPGDLPFDRFFATLTGEAFHSELGLPLAGASISAVDAETGETLSTAVSGTILSAFNPGTEEGALFRTLPSFHILDGRYELVVPVHRSFLLHIEPVDGQPLAASNVNETVLIAASFPLFPFRDFPEEVLDRTETDTEAAPDPRIVPRVRPGDVVTGLDFATNRVLRLGNPLGLQAAPDFLTLEPDQWVAFEIPAAELEEALAEGGDVVEALFLTGVTPPSGVARFRRAAVTAGRRANDGSVTLTPGQTFLEERFFVGQGADSARLPVPDPAALTERLEAALDEGLEALYLVLQADRSQRARPRVGLRVPAAGAPRSFLSDDGVRFLPLSRGELLFQLLVQAGPPPQ